MATKVKGENGAPDSWQYSDDEEANIEMGAEARKRAHFKIVDEEERRKKAKEEEEENNPDNKKKKAKKAGTLL
jgi:hypothetical protein